MLRRSLLALALALTACSASPEPTSTPSAASPASGTAAEMPPPDESVASPDPDPDNPANAEQPGQAEPVSLAVGAAPAMPKDGFQLQSMSIDGDKLTVQVGYGGGCEAHDFRMHWDGTFLKSNPPQAVLTLHHDSHGDSCEAYISETMVMDLAPIRERTGRASGHVVVRVGEKRADLRW